MRVLVAFDKFKEALTAREACDTAVRSLREKHPDWRFDVCPLSDGGDGFEEVLSSAVSGDRMVRQVTGPRGTLVETGFTLVPKNKIAPAAIAKLQLTPGSAVDANVALIEMATASGLALLPPTQRDPWQTTSRGTGQLMRAAAEAGAAAIVLGIGGSATHDLGLGALSALGLEFRDANGASIRPPIPSAWEQINNIAGTLLTLPPIYVACDVTNPLLGPKGAAAVFAPQKGLHADEFTGLEIATERIAQMLCAHFHQPLTLPGMPGTGAAGGMAFGLMCALQAQLLPGFGFVADWLALDAKIAAADLVISGEGRFDATSLGGKGPGAVLSRAIAAKKRVFLFAGQIASPTAHDLLSLHEITPTDVPLDRALHDAAHFLKQAIQRAL
ncbi:MAG: glycerate kinase [Nibricoccus sp.]